jgi:TRAP-type uncharacterized transport system substrate-binding protein
MQRLIVCVLFLVLAASGARAQQVILPSAEPEVSSPLVQLAQAGTRKRGGGGGGAPTYAQMKDKYNKWTVGLAAGLYEGAGTRMASELAKALQDDENLRVLPLLTAGLFANVYDLLYLKGIDVAIVNGDILEHFKKSEESGIVTQRINYIANLYVGEVHILARPEINSINDLAGKVVNFNVKSSATAYTGPLMFERLGIKVIPNFDPHLMAVAEMAASDRVAALAFVSSKPLQQFQKNFPPGFKFLSVPYDRRLEDLYLPSNLTPQDYPGLIRQGERVETVAVPTLLAAYDWPADNDRHRRMVRFIDALFDRLPVLQSTPGNHPKWKDINLAGQIPGWKRFPPMQRRLDVALNELTGSSGASGRTVDINMARQIARKLSNDPGEQERIVKEFLEWAKTRK